MRLLPLPIALLVLLAAAIAACGGSGESPPGEPAPPVADTTPSLAPGATPDTIDEVTLLQPVPDGGPMPEADRANGIPPYPGAVVHTRFPGRLPEIRTIEAFTPDSWAVVERYYDARLGPTWTKTDAKDTTIYEKANDQAAITLSPWDPEDLPSGIEHAPVLLDARTIIGAAWRPDRPSSSESAPAPDEGG